MTPALGGRMNRGNLGTVGALSLSVVSSVSIVLCNKQLMSGLGFNFGELHGDSTGSRMYVTM